MVVLNTKISKLKGQDMIVSDAQAPRMQILVAAQVGNVGKSTTAAILHQKLRATIYSVESRNQDASRYGIEVRKFASDQLRELRLEMMLDPRHCVVDLGASNFDHFIKQLVIANMVSVFDYVICVADPSGRGQTEAISTFQTLVELGVSPSKFRFLLNRADVSKAIKPQFADLFAFAETIPSLHLNPLCALPFLPVFSELADQGIQWSQAISDTTDYEAMAMALGAAGDRNAAIKAAERALLREWARGAKSFIDSAFDALNIKTVEND